MSTSALTIPSFAKINWSLRVLGKRPDGYHEVRTVLQTISLHDDLHFQLRTAPEIFFHCDHPDVPRDETNLVLQAARLLKSRYPSTMGATIELEKRIPSKAGLGGGSSNAAITLFALAQLWDLELGLAQLVALGSELGADVPFFFIGGKALATGIGTDLTALEDGISAKLIIVTPQAEVSTAEAYRALNSPALTTPNPDFILASSFLGPDSSEFDQWPLHNDFEKVIFEIEPEIKRAQKALFDAGAQHVLLAGSGSSVFGIFTGADTQYRALETIQAEPAWRIFSCDTLSREEYLRAIGPGGTTLLRSANTRFNSGA